MAQTPCVKAKDAGQIVIDYTPVGAKTSGDVIVENNLVGIVLNDIAAGVLDAICVQGVFDVPKDNSDITAAWTPLYWDSNGSPVGGTALSGAFTTTATGNTFAGWSIETAGVGVGTVRMLLQSALAVTVTTLDDLTDVGTVDHTAGDLLIADGTKFECVPLTGAFELAATGLLSMDSNTKAAAGSAQGDATAITAEGFCLVTAADATKGVKLPAAAAGKMVIVKNNANAVLKVYPNTSDAINALSADAAISMAAYTSAIFIAYDATTWYTVPLLPS